MKASQPARRFKKIGKILGKEKYFRVEYAVKIYIGTQESPTASAEPATPNFSIKIKLRIILIGSAIAKLIVRVQARPVPARR